MLFGWLDELGREDRRPSLRRARPRLEALESRTVPAAVRNLPGFLANTLPANEDGSTGLVPLGFTANFFGFVDTGVFVNNNGNVTFGQPLSQFTPSALNTDNGGIPIIAPFFADVDTRGAGSEVQFGNDVLCGRNVFGVNYINVNYCDATDPTHVDLFNSFQVILVDRSETGVGNFDIEFNYDGIDWETGDASGGTDGQGGESARVGYSNGSGAPGTFFELPGSGINGAFLDGGPMALINQTLLSSTPGRLHFLVRNGQVVDVAPTGTLDVTDGTRVLNPFRYITDTETGQQRGFFTLVNVEGVAVLGANATDLCLDIVGAPVPVTSNFPSPITVVFEALPPDISIVNPTGLTASGRPFIQINDALPRDFPALRIPFVINNPDFDSPTTYFGQNFQVRIFAAGFDPSSL